MGEENDQEATDGWNLGLWWDQLGAKVERHCMAGFKVTPGWGP